MSKAQVILKKGKNESILRRHPWVFSGAVKDVFGSPEDGDVVDVIGAKGEFLGAGHFQHGSIMVRLLTFEKEDIDQIFFKKRIISALDYRKRLGLSDGLDGVGNAWRLIYGEADQLPGLIVDFYNGVAVIQTHTSGFFKISKLICEILIEVLGSRLQAVLNKPKDTVSLAQGHERKAQVLWGTIPEKLFITEYGSMYSVDVYEGQKTGFFIDQRENRHIVSSYANGKKVLNMFCYSGGFSVAALKGGASLVHSVDSSASAIELAKGNILLNGYDPELHQCIVSDAFDFLDNMQTDYDMIILDPPAYAKHADARHRAVKGYQRLNTQAISSIKPGGFILTFSCSQVVDKRLFESTIMSSAIISGRNVRIVQELTHAPCHGHAIAHPEGKYLKGLMLYVE